MNSALREAEFNNTSRSRQEIAPALADAPTRDASVLAALAWSRVGDIEQAERMAQSLADQFPLNTAINRYWLPAVYASIEIRRGNAAKALEDLRTTAQYELGTPLPQFEVGGSLYPVYIRGEAYLLLHQGKEAAAEFQKFLDHSGVTVNCPLGALARLQLGRAYAFQGDNDQGTSGLSRLLRAMERRRPRHSDSDRRQIRIREAAINRSNASPGKTSRIDVEKSSSHAI